MKPKSNQIWKHKKHGTLYTVIMLTNEKATNPSFIPSVVYVDEKGDSWSRPISEWTNSMELIEE